MLSVFCGILMVTKPVEAKSVSKVSKVITLTQKKKEVTHNLSINRKENVIATIKFLKVKGKIPKKENELYFGYYTFVDGKGSFFSPWTEPEELKKSSFKKGKTLKSNDYIYGTSEVTWTIPRGIKKLKVKVTYSTKSGKAGIISVK